MLKFTKTRTVLDPRRANDTDAGLDFFVPEFDVKFIDDFMEKNQGRNFGFDSDAEGKECILLPALERIKIPLGVKTILPENTDLTAHNRSGLSTKLGIIKTAELVDEHYRGEIHAGIINLSSEEVKIYPNQAIIQFVHRDHRKDKLEFISESEYEKETESENNTRKGKGFGSSDNNVKS